MWFLAGVLWPLDVPTPNARPARLLIANVAVVDLENGLIRQGQSILVEHGEIVTIGVGLAANAAQVLDARGRYAIPGMFDMHVHSIKMAPALTHPLFVASGVTAVRRR